MLQPYLSRFLSIGAVLGSSLIIPSQAPAQADLTIDANRLRSSIIFQVERFNKNSCAVQENCVSGTGKRTLMRFDVTTPNVGNADLVLGTPSQNPDLYTYSPCHGHYHFNGYATYELLEPVRQRPVVTGRKQAFCLLDNQRWDPNAGPAKFTCSYQGISAGWADTYSRALDCQWLDVTGVAPGEYLLRVVINPERILPESNFNNNSAVVPVTIPSRSR